jgi:amino acid adenylation domain-containing protein
MVFESNSRTLSGIFQQQSLRHGDKLALCSPQGSWTYADLHARAQTVAHAVPVRQQGIQSPVAVLTDDHSIGIIAMLGILMSGSPFVYLDSRSPAKRLERIAKQAGIDYLVCGHDHLALAAAFISSDRIIDVSTVKEPLFAASPLSAPGANSLAYALFTSGSTGEPKAVVQSHQNACYYNLTYVRRLNITPEDRISLLTSPGFDAGLMDVFGALNSGASLHVWPLLKSGILDLYQWICDERITILHLTPSLFRVLMESSGGKGQPPSLRYIVLGGEAVRSRDLALFQEKFDGRCTLINGYGPSESTLATQAFFIGGGKTSYNQVPIGTAVEGTSVTLIHEGERDAWMGEILIESPHIFVGYLKSKEDWERLAVPVEGVRSYATGDLARLLPDGQLIYLGRKDEQIKINGIAVVPSAIERELLKQVDALDAVVIAEESGNDLSLVGYVLVPAGSTANEQNLREQLSLTLPVYLIPSRLYIVHELPRLGNGKVNKQELLKQRQALEAAEEVPDSGLEGRLAEIIKAVLKLSDPPGHKIGFFQLGGHSLAALVVIGEIKKTFNVNLSPTVLLNNGNIKKIAAEVAKAFAR